MKQLGPQPQHQRDQRSWAFEQGGVMPAKPSANPAAADLHQRADQMFRLGYHASGWKLRERAWRAEGGM